MEQLKLVYFFLHQILCLSFAVWLKCTIWPNVWGHLAIMPICDLVRTSTDVGQLSFVHSRHSNSSCRSSVWGWGQGSVQATRVLPLPTLANHVFILCTAALFCWKKVWGTLAPVKGDLSATAYKGILDNCMLCGNSLGRPTYGCDCLVFTYFQPISVTQVAANHLANISYLPN